jgi:IclR family transcriptional regulator, KDG regulon repressor
MRRRQPPNGEAQSSVEKALRILTCFSPEEPELGVSEIARRLGIGVSTAHRLLSFMIGEDFVRQNPATAKYSLGYRVVHLASTVLAGANFRTACQPHMRTLRDETSETVRAYILAGRECICVEEVVGVHEIRASGAFGQAAPLYVGAGGKMLLSQLPAGDVDQIVSDGRTQGWLTHASEGRLREELKAIQRRGYAQTLGDTEDLAASIAAPVRNFTGAAIGSLVITGPVGRWTEKKIGEFVPNLIKAATAISSELGYSAGRTPRPKPTEVK